MDLPFQQVDVFTAIPFKGNPVAVILDGENLPEGRPGPTQRSTQPVNSAWSGERWQVIRADP